MRQFGIVPAPPSLLEPTNMVVPPRSKEDTARIRNKTKIAVSMVLIVFLYSMQYMSSRISRTVPPSSSSSIIRPNILQPNDKQRLTRNTLDMPQDHSSTRNQLPAVSSNHCLPDLLLTGLDQRARGVFVDMENSVNDTIATVVQRFMDPLSAIPSAHLQPRNLIKTQQNDESLRNNTVLIQIRNNNPTFTILFSPPTRHGRLVSVKAAINALTQASAVPDVTFLVLLNDGFRPSVPLFGSARHWSSWFNLVPVPLGNERGREQGTGSLTVGWDNYIQLSLSASRYQIPWEKKIPKAVFRGNFAIQKQAVGTCSDSGRCTPPESWMDMNRGRLYHTASKRPDLFDVGFTSIESRMRNEMTKDGVGIVERLTLIQQQAFKYVVNMGSNQDWAERLRHSLFSDMAVIRHEAETQEFFYPLLKPYVHYIPLAKSVSDLVEVTEWAQRNDEAVREISVNAYNFAQSFINDEAMLEYWRVALTQFAALQAIN